MTSTQPTDLDLPRKPTDPTPSESLTEVDLEQIQNRLALDKTIVSGTPLLVDCNLEASGVGTVIRLLHECLKPTDKPSKSASAPDREDWQLPNPFGRFEIQERIGVGAFGAVWKAFDPQLQRVVAIKVLHPALRLTPSLSLRFVQEARAAARLNHPNIVRVHDAGTIEQISYIAAEFVDGVKLKTLNPQGPIFTPNQAAELVLQLADAIAHSHAQGVLHRDIKPDNVLLQENLNTTQFNRSTARLTDFGLARIQDDDKGLSTYGILVGTVQYMSPEQLQGGSATGGESSDIYALGVVFYEMLTGFRPRPTANNVYQTIQASRTITSVRSLYRQIHPDIDAICMKCLSLSPHDRYSSADSLRNDLQRFLDGRPTVARPLSSLQHVLRWCGLHRIAASMIGLAIASLSVAMVVLLWSSGRLAEQNIKLEKARASQELAKLDALRHEQQYRHLAWLSSIQRAYAYFEDSRLPAVAQIMNGLKQSHSNETARPEWQLLEQELNRSFRPLYHVNFPLREVVHIPKTNLIAFAGESSDVYIMDLNSKEVARTFSTQVSKIHALAASRDGKQIAIGGATDRSSDTASPWLIDRQTGMQKQLDFAGGTTIEALSFSHDDQLLSATFRYQNAVLIPLNGSASDVVEIESDRRGRSVDWLFTSNEVVVQTGLEKLTLCHVDSSQSTLNIDRKFHAFATIPNSNQIAVSSLDGNCYTIDAKKDRVLKSLKGNSKTPTSMAVSADGRWIASGYVTGEVTVWSLDEDEIVTREPSSGDQNFLPSFATARLFDSETTSLCWIGNNIVATSNHGELVWWSPPYYQQLAKAKTAITAASFDPQNSQLVLGFSDGSLRRFDNNDLYETLQRGERDIERLGVSIAGEGPAAVNAIVIAPTSHWMLASFADHHLDILDLSGNHLLNVPSSESQSEGAPICALAISPDEKWIAWGGESNELSVRRFDGISLEVGFTVKLTADVNAISFLPDLKSIGVSGQFEGIRIYDLESGQMVRQLGSSSGIAMTLLNQSAAVASGSYEGVVRVIPSDGKSSKYREIRTSYELISGIAVSPDDQIAISLSSSGVQASVLPDALHLGYLLRFTRDTPNFKQIHSTQFSADSRFVYFLIGNNTESQSPLFRLYRLTPLQNSSSVMD